MISKRAVFTLILILLFLGMIYASQKTVSTEIYAGTVHPLNQDRYGTSKFYDTLLNRYGWVDIGDTGRLSNLYGLYINIGPDKDFKEVDRLLNYVLNGGNVLLADEYGYFKELLRRLGIYISPTFPSLIYRDVVNPIFPAFCEICNSTDEILLDIPNEFIIGANNTYIQAGIYEFEILGLSSIRYRYNGYIKYTARISGFFDVVEMVGNLSLPVTVEIDKVRYMLTQIKAMDTFNWMKDMRSPEAPSTFINLFSIIFIKVDGGGKMVLLSDTAPFINRYYDEEKYRRFIDEILAFLDPGDKPILFDTSLIKVYTVKVPIPHIGRIILSALTEYLSNIEDMYGNFFSSSTFVLLGSTLIIGLSTFITLRRYLRVRNEANLAGQPVVEKDVVISSESLVSIRDIYGEGFKDFVNNAYDIADLILRERLNISIDEFVRDPKYRESEIYPIINRIYGIHRRVNMRIPFPPILNRRAISDKLLNDLDNLLIKLGGEV